MSDVTTELVVEVDRGTLDDLRRQLTFHTVPWMLYFGDPSDGKYLEASSGVLVRLGERFFILTAGHAIESIDLDIHRVPVFTDPVEVRRAPRTLNEFGFLFKREVVNQKEAFDIGFMEVPIPIARAWEDEGVVSLNEDRIEVLDTTQWAKSDDAFVVCGYPGELHLVESHGRGVQLLYWETHRIVR